MAGTFSTAFKFLRGTGSNLARNFSNVTATRMATRLTTRLTTQTTNVNRSMAAGLFGFGSVATFALCDPYDTNQSVPQGKRAVWQDPIDWSHSSFKDLHNLEQKIDQIAKVKGIPKDELCYKIVDNEWVVIMRKQPGIDTNEFRPVQDKAFALYRANGLSVVEIVNVNNPSTTKYSITTNYNSPLVYKPGYCVIADSFDRSTAVHSHGIKYYLSPAAVFYRRGLSVKGNFTGPDFTYDDDGALTLEGQLNNGYKTGPWTSYQNGIETSTRTY